MSKTNHIIELFNENTNEIIEITISLIDKQIIKNIKNYNNITIKIQVVQFDKLNMIAFLYKTI